ncbi:MAG: ABC transporter permease [Dehalococcoidales bacterium]|nr:ABC transporter permease [Dehalococcoidales bacterium]MDD3264676.1 ABC transporter permease [Dehalococcoidales bacterium]MDD4322667.1 ABC transporter permease [Dehalococcoidales bacterium]MDD4794227.1 ABC transporter permease [Dehalococcoidales bacterium]MDD5121826.1 ABC transporter permease [Dehalococcoidales bacterium]
MEFRSYLIRRLLLLIPVLFGVTILIFGLLQLFPAYQRAMLYVTDPRQLNNIDEIIQMYGLNEPLWKQYFTWLGQVFSGNLGWSKVVGMSVTDAIFNFLPATLELAIFATPIIIIGGIWLGTKSAAHKDGPVDHISRAGAIVGWSLPTFWFGLVLLMIFYGYFTGLFPPERLSTDISVIVHSGEFTRYTKLNFLDGILNWEWSVVFDALRHIVLPVITLSVVNIAFIMRLMRSSMLESLGRGYILTARAKGLPEKTVINKHARRNAMIPVLTVSGYLFAAIVNGVVITESIFNYKGLGWWAWRTAINLDVSSILGFALFSGVLFVLTNLVVDLLYAKFDPRVRLGGSIK